MSATRILVADDQEDVLEALRLMFKHAGIETLTATSPAKILEIVEAQELDVVLMDLNYARDTTSGREGLDLLGQLVSAHRFLPVIVMTAWSSVPGAVEAMRRGARDYIEKPWDNERLLQTVRTHVELSAALRDSERLKLETARLRERQLPELIAASSAMQPVLELMHRVAPSDAPVLITGEHGTGKEVVARWIHSASSRNQQPFIAVNAGGVSDALFESEVFGHVRGAFTDAKGDRAGCFELAERGTLFLDEIGNMPLNQQAKLLRVLQTGEYHPVGSSRTRHSDVRFLAATNRDVRQQVEEGHFREDLLYRVNTIEIHLPALRERRKDILPLASHFITRLSRSRGRTPPHLSEPAAAALMQHPWPGNIRELEHVIERALLLAQGPEIEVRDLLLGPRRTDSSPPAEPMTLEQAERHHIRQTLERCDGQVTEAAKALGLSRSALYRRLQHFGFKGGQ